MANPTVVVSPRSEIGQYVAGMSEASAATARFGDDAMSSSKRSRDGFDMAGKAGLAMGGLVVAGFGMAVSKSMEFEKSMSAIQAATQATSGTLGRPRSRRACATASRTAGHGGSCREKDGRQASAAQKQQDQPTAEAPAPVPQQLPSAGWYPDQAAPETVRWFDGTQWTEFLKPGDAPP